LRWPSGQRRLEVLDRLALVAEFRDDDTNQHAQRVGRSATAIAAALRLPSELQELLGPAVALHDIGKIAIPDSILRKPGSLTSDEFAVMQTHTTIGAQMLAGSEFPVLQTASTTALTHHERFDGAGYPRGLAGEEIPIEGRIAAVADVFDALTSDRVYRPAFAPEVALEMMREESGKQFDPVVLGVLLDSAVGYASSVEVGEPSSRYASDAIAISDRDSGRFPVVRR
jgi:putative two-component system response regulator